MGRRLRSRQRKSSSVQLKNYWPEIDGAWSEYLLWSNSEFFYILTFDLEIFSYFSIQALSFESFKLAASISVWGYIFRMFWSPSSFKVIGLISRSQKQNSGNAQVCAALRHSSIIVCYKSLSVNLCVRDYKFRSPAVQFSDILLHKRMTVNCRQPSKSNLSFECLKLAASFSVWGYVCRISRSPWSWRFMG